LEDARHSSVLYVCKYFKPLKKSIKKMTRTHESVIDEDERLSGLVNRVEIDESHPGQLGALLRVHPLDLEQYVRKQLTKKY
jgi:hypothetical protein